MKQKTDPGKRKKRSIDLDHFTESGFTLVEVMVVVAIIALIALFAAPEMSNFGPNMRVKAAARDLHGNLQKMKTEAIKQNRATLITFTPITTTCPPADATSPGGSYTIDMNGNTNTYNLPQNTALCKLESLEDGATVFKFTSLGLLVDNDDDTYPTKERIFQIENDRDPTRTYQVSVSIAGGVSTEKL